LRPRPVLRDGNGNRPGAEGAPGRE